MDADSSRKLALLDRLADEFAERRRRGERPSLTEYADRYPELADDIRALFPALAEVEQAADQRAQAHALRAEPPPLSRLGDYRIVREIGRGGMGVVYEAEQESLGRRVALKVLPLQAARDARALERFRREARSAAKLHHTNIVPVFEVGQDGDVCYYAMQFIAGHGLDQVIEELRRLRAESETPRDRAAAPESPARTSARSLRSGSFGVPTTVGDVPPPGPEPAAPSGSTSLSGALSGDRHFFASVARIGQQTAAALAHAHERGVVHRDIKPSNLLLDGDGVVWVADFGLAKGDDDGLTSLGNIVGTLRYMAPERFQGQCDARADIYALGLTLYELLTLRPAFQARDRLELIEQVRSREPARPRSVDPRAPRDLETIILKAIDKEPRRRYQTAAELGEDLRLFLAGEPIRARPVGGLERLSKWARRHPWLARLSGALALSLAAGIAVSVYYALAERARAQEADARAAEAREKAAEAREKAAEASKQQGLAEAAGKELQRALALGLFRGLPREDLSRIPGDGLGGGLGGLELEALWDLAGLRIEEVRFRFLEEALADPDKRRVLSNRRAIAVHAAVGVDPGRRRRVLDLLLARLKDPRSDLALRLACVKAGNALGPVDAAFAREALQTLREALDGPDDLSKRPNLAVERADLIRVFRAASVWADRDDARRFSAFAARQGCEALRQRTLTALNYPETVWEATADHLDADLGESFATLLARDQLDILQTNRQPPIVQGCCATLRAVAGRLDRKEAAAAARRLRTLAEQTGADERLLHFVSAWEAAARAADDKADGDSALILILNKSPLFLAAPGGHDLFARCVRAASARLSPEQAAAAAWSLEEKLPAAPRPAEVRFWALGWLAAADKLDEEEARRGAARMIQAVAGKVEKTASPDDLPALAEAAAALAGRLPPQDAARLTAAPARRIQALAEACSDPAPLGGLLDAWRALADRVAPDEAGRSSAALTRHLLGLMGKTTDAPLLFVQQLPTAARRLGREGKDVAQRIIGQLRDTRDPILALWLVRTVREMAAGLDREDRAEAVRAVVGFLGRSQLPLQLEPCAEALTALAAGLERDEAAAAAAAVVAALSRSGGVPPLDALARALRALLDPLGRDEAEKLADDASRVILKRLEGAPLPGLSTRAARGLAALGDRMSPGQAGAAGAAATLADHLAISGTGPGRAEDPEAIAHAFGAMLRTCTEQQLVDVLKMPTCVGQLQRAVLDELGRRRGRPFADLWEAVAWLSESQPAIDLSSPTRRSK
jgi:serine/threonine protein kinase